MNKQKGFTLIELMIVVAIVGIISAIAYPSYEQYVIRSKRNEAMAALTNAVQAMERYRAANFSYEVNDGLATIFATTVPVDGGAAYYNLTLTSSATTYTITATPTGSMAGRDNVNGQAGVLSIDQSGTRSWGNKACWPEGTNDCTPGTSPGTSPGT